MRLTANQMTRLRPMRLAALAEATTLALLVLVAVPLKYMAGTPQMVQWLGPVHGVAFVAYVAVLGWAVAGGGWRRHQVALAVAAAFVPLAGFAHERLIARRVRA